MATDLNAALRPRPGLRLARRRPLRAMGTAGLRDVDSVRNVFVLSSFVVIYMAAIGFGAAKGNSAADLSSGQGDWLQQVVYVLLVALVLYASVLARQGRAIFTALPMPMVLVLVWCWLSVSWAIEPEIALRRVVLTTIIAWTVFRSVDAIDYEKPIDAARVVLVLTLVGNYLFALFMPSGIHHGVDDTGGSLEGAWKGLTGHKNFAGAVCAFTILMFAFDTGRMRRYIGPAVIAGSTFFLYMTESKTSEGILAVSLAVGFGFRIYNPAYRMLALVAAAVLIAVAVMFVRIHWYAITDPFFMPRDFTNRGQIWNVIFGYVRDHWLLGTGYGSFWNIGFASPAYQYITKWQLWIVGIGSGHSGYFDLLATIGVPGLMLAVFATIVVPAYRLITSHNIAAPQRALLGSMLAFCAGHNLTETSLLDRDSLVNVFVLLVVASIYKAARTRRLALTYQPEIASTVPADALLPAGSRGSAAYGRVKR